MTRLQSLRDAPGTAREYETTYVLRPGTANEGVAEVNTRVKGIIEGLGGRIMKVDNWGKRRLAYEVSKERKGIYLYWLYLGNPGVVEEIERNLRMLDGVLRYLTVKVDTNVDIGARPSEIDDAAYEKASTTAADEEDMFLTRGGDGEGPDTLSDEDDEDDFVYVEGGNKKDKEPAPVPAPAPAPVAVAVEGDDAEKE